MDDVPPPEAFEPQPDEASAGRNTLRRRVTIAVTLIVVAALVVLAAVEGGGFIIRGDGVDTSARDAVRLAVVDSAGALTVVDRQGGAVVPYSVPGVTFVFPAWSPDGSHIAAIGQGAKGTGIYVFAVRAPVDAGQESADPGQEPVVAYQSADRPPFYLYWTPDGRQVTFLTTEPDGLALRLAPADGSATAVVVRSGAPMYWDFVDEARLLVHSGTSGADGFFGEVGVDGAPFKGTGRAAGIFRAPAVSSDDRFRAYLGAGDGAIGEVVRESRDGSGTTRIRVFGPAAVGFSPTSDALAFVAPDQLTSGAIPLPVGPLRILDPGAAEPRTLLAGSVVAFFWSPTGDVIAVLRLDDTQENIVEAGWRHRETAVPASRGVVARDALGRADMARDNPAVEATAREGIARETLSRDAAAREAVSRDAAAREAVAGLALRLSFVEVATGAIRSERTVQVSDLFVNQVLPFFDQYALSHRFWSADGAAIVLPVVGDGAVTQLLAIPVDGADATVVATAEMGFWSP